MLTRFSCRTVQMPQRCAAALSVSTPQWMTAHRWCSTEGAEKPKAEEAKEEPKAEEKPKEKEAPKPEPKKDESAGKIKKLEEQNAELKKELQYVTADAQNARRIGREDTEKAKNFAVTGFAKDMLEVADTLDRAIDALNKLDKTMAEDNKSFKNVLTGVKMCDSVLMSAFQKHNISKVDVKPGTEFDPSLHEALFNAPATPEIGAGKVVSVIKSGYNIKERVLRAAQVGVAEEQK